MAVINLTTNLVAYWKLDEASGNAADATGGGNTLTNSSATYAAAKIKNGGVFSGSAQYMYNSTVPNTGANAWSTSYWIKTSVSTNNDNDHWGWGTGTSLKGIGGYFNSTTGKIRWNAYGGGGSVISANALNDNKWHFICITYDGTYVRMYVDNLTVVQSSSVTLNIVSAANKTCLGRQWYSPQDNYFTGSIDEVAMWSRCLTATEVKELYTNGGANQYPFASGKMVNFMN